MAQDGNDIKDLGWRQARILDNVDLAALVDPERLELTERSVGIVASQSCDLVHPLFEVEPWVEIVIGEFVDAVDPNFTHGKSTRKLHIEIHSKNGDSLAAEFSVHNKLSFSREKLLGITPSEEYEILRDDERTFCHWLASRYKRDALPDEFDLRWKRILSRRKKKFKKASEVSGLYVQLYPDGEVGSEDYYSVNVIVLVKPGVSQEVIDRLEGVADTLRADFEKEKIDADCVVKTEDKVSVATIKLYKRFDLDHITLKGDVDHEDPPTC